MEFANAKERHNFKCQLVEGGLYIGTRSLLSPETMFPALIQRLGGNEIAIGAIPIIVYLALLLPQIIGANRYSHLPYRKTIVIRGGFVQRVHIFLLALCVGIFGGTYPALALAGVLILYSLSQMWSGLITPMWGEFVAKTVSPSHRGKLLGFRTSLGSALGFLNGFIMVALLGNVQFPLSYACIFLLAGILQMGSLVAQNKVIEDVPSRSTKPISFVRLYVTVRRILRTNKSFKKFLLSSSLITISFMSVAFFTVSALKKFSLDESYVGLFTIISIASQVLSSATLGLLADKKGSKVGLMICAASLISASFLALIAQSVVYYYFVFFFVGIELGAESFLRYNIAVEYAPSDERALYVGLMNAWFAPFYIFSLVGGWIITSFGYSAVFALSILFGGVGLYCLYRVPEIRKK